MVLAFAGKTGLAKMAINASLMPETSAPAPRRRAVIVIWPEASTSRMAQDEAHDVPLSDRQIEDQRWSRWMALAQGGDRSAYNALLREIVPLIQRVARRQGVEGAAVDDVVQDVLSSIHRARHTYDPSRSFAAWATTISQRRAIDVLRRLSRHATREAHAPLAYENYAEPGMEPDRPLDEAERARILREAIADLAEGQREAVEHLAIREMSLSEAARLTGKSKGALKVNLHRAMKALRRRLGGAI
jgi:RNA polymerase sigma-70 factor (ECF subfamily)